MKKLLKSVAALSLSAMMLLSPAVLAEEDEEESNVVELTTVVQEYEGKQIVLKTAGLDILEQDGYKFKDLNKNGELDPYEDWRLTPEERTEDLLSRMSDKNKAAQMAHMTLVTLKESWFSDLDIGFALTYTYFAESKESAGEKMNYVQSLCEESVSRSSSQWTQSLAQAGLTTRRFCRTPSRWARRATRNSCRSWQTFSGRK